ncbi:unnamed protein product [Strongylus vulgaris]|uniref:Uncharacterized protein n=1 Tax=Strongylus vulgaris TaxID=40348 RepID=A0A3P7JNQ2_STRVU|nr:unnamed protein product [Strongylus vulgaris]
MLLFVDKGPLVSDVGKSLVLMLLIVEGPVLDDATNGFALEVSIVAGPAVANATEGSVFTLFIFEASVVDDGTEGPELKVLIFKGPVAADVTDVFMCIASSVFVVAVEDAIGRLVFMVLNVGCPAVDISTDGRPEILTNTKKDTSFSLL